MMRSLWSRVLPLEFRLKRSLRWGLTVLVISAEAAQAVSYPVEPDDKRGVDPQGAYDIGEVDTVNLFNGNLAVRLPVSPVYPISSGVSFGLTLTYNSKAWDYHPNSGSVPATNVRPEVLANAGVGWRLSLGELLSPGDPRLGSFGGGLASWVYVGADGSDHAFYGAVSTDCSSQVCYSRDGTYLRLTTEGDKRVVAFPDGTRHYFELRPSGAPATLRWRLVDIVGAHATLASPDLTVSYSCPGGASSCLPAFEAWVIADRHLRETTVQFKPHHTGDYHLVESITVPTFGGGVGTYDFFYAPPPPEPPEPPAPPRRLYPACLGQGEHTNLGLVPILDRVRRPDGSYFSMTYDERVPLGNCSAFASAGLLTSLRLPSGGNIGWAYDFRDLPVTACEANVWTTRTVAVSGRQLRDTNQADLGTRSYGASLSPHLRDLPQQPQECVGVNANLGNGPSEEMKVSVTDPGKDRTVHYFSVYPGIPAGDAQASVFDRNDYGLPFSRAHGDGTWDPRFLSTEVFDCPPVGCPDPPGTPVRRTYVRYERDTDCTIGLPVCGGRNNQRVSSARVEFVDDGHANVTTDFTDFDGVGHYRKTEYSSDYATNPNETKRAVEITNWNAGQQGPPPESAPWILNTYSFKESRAEGRTFRTEFDFDPSSGFLNSVRRLKSTASTPAAGDFDVVTRFTEGDLGFVALEEWFGGDCRGVNDGCPSATTPSYVFRHGYEAGVRSLTEALDDSGGVVLRPLALSIDGPSGLVRVNVEPGGLETAFEYDLMGRLLRSTPTGAAPTVFDYSFPTESSPDQALSVTRTTGTKGETFSQEQRFFDGLARPVRHEFQAPEGLRAQMTKYHPTGAVSEVSEVVALPQTAQQQDSNHYTKYKNYDPFGRPREIVSLDGSSTTISYQGNRFVSRTSKVWTGPNAQEDPKGVATTTTEEYDALGRLRLVTEPNGRKWKYDYDAAGNMSQARPVASKEFPQNRWFVFDGRGFLTKETHPESGDKSYLYDALGNVQTTITPVATLTSWFDRAGRPFELRVATGAGQTGLLRSFDYFEENEGTGGGKLREATAKNWRQVGAQCLPFDVVDHFAYDAAGRMESKQTEIWKDGVRHEWNQSYGYDDAGQLTLLNYPHCGAGCSSTARGVETHFEFGRPTRISDSETASNFASSIAYSPNGTVASVTHGNGAVFTQTPDSSGLPRPAALGVTGSGSSWSEAYSYDGSGNIKSIGDKDFTYDVLSRLTSARIPDAGAKPYQAYSYDRFGNLTAIRQGSGPGTLDDNTNPDFKVDPATNRLKNAGQAGTASYNAAGSLTSAYGNSFTWDPLEQLATVNTGSEAWVHTYDAAGERVWSWKPPVGSQPRIDTYSLRDPGGALLREFKRENSGPWSYEDYIYREDGLLATVKPGNSVRHFHLDHLGSVRVITAGGQAFEHDSWPYGQEFTGQADGEQMRFTGHERDLGATTASSGAMAARDDLDYMHARYYKPLWGRFLTADPSSGSAGAGSTWNQYSYTWGNPLSFVDPDGLCARVVDGVCYEEFTVSASEYTDTDYLFAEDDEIQWGDLDFAKRVVAQTGLRADAGLDAVWGVQVGANVEVASQFIPPLRVGKRLFGAAAARTIPKSATAAKSWSTVRKAYWKVHGPGGKAPTREVLVRNTRTGQVYRRMETKELDHVVPRHAGGNHDWSNLREVWPTEHAALDPYRRTGYEVIKVLSE